MDLLKWNLATLQASDTLQSNASSLKWDLRDTSSYVLTNKTLIKV